MTDRRTLEQIAMVEQTLMERRRNDPLLNWQPHTKQRRFIDAAKSGKYRQTWFIAANRSGKSEAGACVGAELARFGTDDPPTDFGNGVQVRDPATSGWVVALDANVSRDTIQPKYFDNGYGPPGQHGFIPPREIAEYPTQHNPVLKLKNGSLIGFRNCEQERTKFQGSEKDWIHFDEEPPYSVFEESTMRVGQKKLRIFGTCTLLPPEGQTGGVSWMFSEIIQAWQEGQRPDIAIFGASIYDNPNIPPEEIALLEAQHPEGSTSRRIRLDGEWLPGLSGARAYPSFNRSLHVNPLGEPDPRKPLVWTWDFNVEPMVSLVGQRHGSMYYFYDELLLEEGNIDEMIDLFRDRYPRHGAEIHLYGDATGRGRSHHDNKSSYTLILNAMKAYRAPIRFKVPQSNPPVTDRINAINRLFRDELGEVRIQIDPDCRELIEDFEQVLRDRKGGIKKTTNPKDPYARRTHMSDAAGYWLAHEEPVTPLDSGRGGRHYPLPKQPGYGICK